MSFNERMLQAVRAVGEGGIVCVCFDGQCGLAVGMESATEAQVMTALATMHRAVIDCTTTVYNSINEKPIDRAQAERLLSELGDAATTNHQISSALRRRG